MQICFFTRSVPCAPKSGRFDNTSLPSQHCIMFLTVEYLTCNSWYISNNWYLKTDFLTGIAIFMFKTYLLSNILAVFHVMAAIGNYLWFNNGYQTILKRKMEGTEWSSVHWDLFLKIFNIPTGTGWSPYGEISYKWLKVNENKFNGISSEHLWFSQKRTVRKKKFSLTWGTVNANSISVYHSRVHSTTSGQAS